MAKINGDNELLQFLQRLTFQNIEHIYRDSLRDSIRPIYGETKEQLRKHFSSNSGERFLDWNREFRWSTHWNGEAYEGSMFINPQGALKWFELGTDKRYRKNGGYTGKIKGKYVFNNIIDQKVDTILNNAANLVMKNLEEEINK